MQYVEYAVSHGEGTLIAHGVTVYPWGKPLSALGEISEHEFPFSWLEQVSYPIQQARYHEFISIHGSERAV